jgi:hypothetical protein
LHTPTGKARGKKYLSVKKKYVPWDLEKVNALTTKPKKQCIRQLDKLQAHSNEELCL